jgi:phenylalanine-4-hydroxylase
MLINPAYCALAEEIGKASLGATDKTIWHLTKVYWYTIEFGVVREGEADKAFGAGILSRCAPLSDAAGSVHLCMREAVQLPMLAVREQCASSMSSVLLLFCAHWLLSVLALCCSFSELAWMGSGEAQVSRLDPWHTLPKMSYKDGHQQQYFCLDSFESGADTLHRFSQEIQQHEGQWLPRKD